MSKIHKFEGKNGNFKWDGVDIETYPNDLANNVTKQEMLGLKEGAKNFAVRYFEVAAGSHTYLDSHEHDHGVVIIRGRGEVLLDKNKYDIQYGDAIFISPFENINL